MSKKHQFKIVRRVKTHFKAIFSPSKTPGSRYHAVKNAVMSGHKFIVNTKRVVTIGGGTGTFVTLSALKSLPGVSLSAIVSVADDGGSTGRLRDSYGYLPVGDARQALVALAKDGTLLRDLFTYRFSKGDIAGHNLGNLLLTALTDKLGSEGAAIRATSEILRVKGYVVPVSEHPATLVAELENGEKLIGQHTINARPSGGAPIVSLATKENIALSDEAELATESADIIILGPGDLYTSTLANFAVPGLKEAVERSSAKIIYFVNLFSTAAETPGYTASKYVEEITRYVGRRPDCIVVHTEGMSEDILNYYAGKNAFPVIDDLGDDATVVRGAIADVVALPKIEGDAIERSIIRHDPKKIASIVQSFL